MTRSAQVGPPTLTELKECPGCGLFHVVPSLRPGMSARCSRCPTTLHRVGSHSLDYSIALTVGALVMLIIMCATTLMNVQTAGIMHQAGLFSGPVELVHRGMGGLAAVVVFVTVIAPFGKLIATLYVLIRIQEATPPRHLRRIFRLSEQLRPWSMIEVFVFGVFVAYVKLGDVVHIGVEVGMFALLALTFIIIWADSGLDHEAVWDRLGSREIIGGATLGGSPAHAPAGAASCETCGLVSVPRPDDPRCPRCDAHGHGLW
jgi:paraquat-inducible protein A